MACCPVDICKSVQLQKSSAVLKRRPKTLGSEIGLILCVCFPAFQFSLLKNSIFYAEISALGHPKYPNNTIHWQTVQCKKIVHVKKFCMFFLRLCNFYIIWYMNVDYKLQRNRRFLANLFLFNTLKQEGVLVYAWFLY